MACKEIYMRQMPGRLVGRTIDADGEQAFTLTIQTREQHIKREKATSNICSNQSLIALSATLYLSLLGEKGFRDAGIISFNLAHELSEKLSRNGIKTLNNKGLDFEYRNSIFKKERKQIILSTTLIIDKDDPKKIIEVVESRKKRRIESQPLDYPSAGSVFRNPEGNYAGKLIEDLGLKRYTIGGAKVSEKHANFIINAGNATGEDIKELIEYIQSKVKENYNIDLILEQELVNF